MTTYAATDFVDQRTGEVIVEAGEIIDDETLYRLEMMAVDSKPHFQYHPLPCPVCGRDLLSPAHEVINGYFICQ